MVGIKGVIFDLDGTLIDSLDAYVKAFNEVVEKYGLKPVSREELAGFLDQALSLSIILLRLYPQLFSDEKLRRKCEDEIRKAYFRLEKHVPPIMHAAEVLSKLKEMGLKVGVVTARTTRGRVKWLELERLGLAQFIDAMVTGAEVARKPAPDGIIKCLSRLKLKAEECMYVGNGQADLEAGRAALVKTILLNVKMEKSNETKTIHSLKELLRMVIKTRNYENKSKRF